MIRQLCGAMLMVCGLGNTAMARDAEDLIYAMGLRQIVTVMEDEGRAYGASLGDEMFPGRNMDTWDQAVQRIHDPALMERTVAETFQNELGDLDLQEMLSFYDGGPGAQIVSAEIRARRAMMDDAVEEAARDAYQIATAEGGTLIVQLDRFIAANDLVEANVSGALNASYKFYSGLADGEAITMSEGEILDTVWSQEAEARADSQEWVGAFLMLAYGDLDPDVLDQHIALSETPTGQAVNRALFAGFNKMYDNLSYALGFAAAQQVRMTDL